MTNTIENTITALDPTTLFNIKLVIETELLKRGITAPFTIGQELNRNETATRITLKGEPFQTVPVLFREIRVTEFNSSISKVRDGTLKVWVSIYAEYRNFESGSNAVRLFDFLCTVIRDQNDVYKVEIR